MKQNGISTTRIAEICGVSQGTVDRALNDRKGINPLTKERILAVAKEYGYRPNIHARSMAGGRSMLIGVVVFDLNNQYFSDILTSIEEHCAAKSYSTVVMFTGKDHQREITAIKNLYDMAVDGIILCPCNQGVEYESYLLSLNTPIVTIGNKLDRIPYVGIDNVLSMRGTVDHVLRNGYESLVYVKPGLKEHNTSAQAERFQAFCAACRYAKAEYHVTDIVHAGKEISAQKKTAFICPTDIYAIRLLPYARHHQVGIIGFDNIRLIDELGLCLDSVSYDVKAAADMATDYIIEGKAVSHLIKHRLVKRGSI